MSRLIALSLALVLGLALAACDSQPAAETQSEVQAAKSAEGGEAAAAKVEVPKEGKKFDPAIEKSQVPDGAWICDMGTVHYARGEKGDGKCPECGMMLTEHKH